VTPVWVPGWSNGALAVRPFGRYNYQRLHRLDGPHGVSANEFGPPPKAPANNDFMTFEEWYAERSKPSRQQDLTPEERKEWAAELRERRLIPAGKHPFLKARVTKRR